MRRLGLGEAADRKASLLSGGERTILALGLVLMEEPDLLLLDEPGNHLDFAGLSWLEDFIRNERRALVLVSFSGNWSAWRVEKLRRAAGEGRDWQADRKRIERLEALVARFAEIARTRADPAWGKRLRARRSQLAREKEAATERPDIGGRKRSISLDGGESKADFALIVRGYLLQGLSGRGRGGAGPLQGREPRHPGRREGCPRMSPARPAGIQKAYFRDRRPRELSFQAP